MMGRVMRARGRPQMLLPTPATMVMMVMMMMMMMMIIATTLLLAPARVRGQGFGYETVYNRPRAECVVRRDNRTAEMETSRVVALDECPARECARAALTSLSNAIAEVLPAGITEPVLCRVPAETRTRETPADRDCRCEFPYWDVAVATKRLAGKHSIAIFGDSTSRHIHYTLSGLPKRAPKDMQDLQRKLDHAQWSTFGNLGLGKIDKTAPWVRWYGGMSKMATSDFGANWACLKTCQQTGLVMRNWGLHVLHLPPARGTPLLATARTYPAFVAAAMLKALEEARKCGCPTFVTWKETNVICDRTNLGQGNHYTTALKQYLEARRQLNISTPRDVTQRTVDELDRLANEDNRTLANSAAAYVAREVVPRFRSGGVAAFLATFDEFGTRYFNSLAATALSRVEQYLSGNHSQQPYGAFATPDDLEVLPHLILPDLSKHVDVDKGRKHKDLSASGLPLINPVQEAKMTRQDLETFLLTDAGHAREHLLPPLDIFSASLKFCAHTQNDARHYMGLQWIEIRAIYETMMALDLATGRTAPTDPEQEVEDEAAAAAADLLQDAPPPGPSAPE